MNGGFDDIASTGRRPGIPADQDLDGSQSIGSDGPRRNGANGRRDGPGDMAPRSAGQAHPPPQWPPPRPERRQAPAPATRQRGNEAPPNRQRGNEPPPLRQTPSPYGPRTVGPETDGFGGRGPDPRRERSSVPLATKAAFFLAGAAIIFLVANQFRSQDAGTDEAAEVAVSSEATEDGTSDTGVPAAPSQEEGAGDEQPQGETSVPLAEDTTTSVFSDPNWPGGTGPVPNAPPLDRRALITPDGRMILTGSAPTWNVVTGIVKLAGEKLPGGPNSVENEIKWHPDAEQSLQWSEVVMVNAANFSAGGADITPGSLGGLDLTAEILQNNPTSFVVVVGHSDNSGDADANAQLAVDRAEAVIDYLKDNGVGDAQIEDASAGSDDPLVSNETEAGRAANRRVEIQFKNLLSEG